MILQDFYKHNQNKSITARERNHPPAGSIEQLFQLRFLGLKITPEIKILFPKVETIGLSKMIRNRIANFTIRHPDSSDSILHTKADARRKAAITRLAYYPAKCREAGNRYGKSVTAYFRGTHFISSHPESYAILRARINK